MLNRLHQRRGVCVNVWNCRSGKVKTHQKKKTICLLKTKHPCLFAPQGALIWMICHLRPGTHFLDVYPSPRHIVTALAPNHTTWSMQLRATLTSLAWHTSAMKIMETQGSSHDACKGVAKKTELFGNTSQVSPLPPFKESLFTKKNGLFCILGP